MHESQKETIIHNERQFKSKKLINENDYCNKVSYSPTWINKTNIELGNVPKLLTT